MRPGDIGDLFAGGGGASVGIEAAFDRPVTFAINHDPVALEVHKANHPKTKHLTVSIWDAKPKEVCRGRHLMFLWASPDCTHFSVAKGGKPRKQNIRSLAHAVVEWARDVRPDVIMLENVREFLGWGPLDSNGLPNKARMGETFNQWRGRLELLGYRVDHRILDASLYGVPTRRRRLFLIARCDGEPIVWPEPTHGPGKLPVHTAAECIDWSLPCRSIFDRPRPLAEATLRRIAAGVFRFVVNHPDPFIIETAFTGKPDSDRRSQSIHAPMNTMTSRHTQALVVPLLINTRNGERHGRHGEQAPRVFDIRQPMNTITAQGSQGALVTAFLARHNNAGNGGFAGGTDLRDPMPTVMTVDQKALVQAQLGDDLGRAEQVSAFLFSYYSKGGDPNSGADLRMPLPTVTTRDRFGLVMVKGRPIVDLMMRMLEPHELLRAQFGKFAASYDLSAAKTKRDQVRLIGNSVCPELVEQLVRANITKKARRAA